MVINECIWKNGRNYKMKKDHVRISIDLSKALNEKLRQEADKRDMSMNALIRLALENYFKNTAN